VQGQGGGGFGFLQQAAGVVQDAFAEFGDGQAPGAAGQQPFPQGCLQGGDAAGEGGLGQAHPLGGLGKAARFHDAGEQHQVVGVQLEVGGHGGLRA